MIFFAVGGLLSVWPEAACVITDEKTFLMIHGQMLRLFLFTPESERGSQR